MPIPPTLHNDGNYVISLSNVVKWLAAQAEEAGVELYPGFAGAEVLYENDRVVGVATGDMGIGKDGKPKPNFTRGMELRGKITLFGEGCRGSLSKQIIRRHQLQTGDPQMYGIGVKEVRARCSLFTCR